MSKIRILITVKTYPTLSNKYDELVCTAGFREDGSWIRIYPVPFRKLDYEKQYSKWQWIEMDVVKNTSDSRPESYRPANLDEPFVLREKIDTKKGWMERKNLVLRNNIYTNMKELIAEAKDRNLGTSLAIVKPKEIIDFIWEPSSREWDKTKLDEIKAKQHQLDMFEEKGVAKLFQVVKKLPYKFSYVFTTDDGQTRSVMIEDWELGQLFWNCLYQYQDEEVACKKVKEKYFTWMTQDCDLHFFMGTTLKYHNMAPNPFIIIGNFYPPKSSATPENQLSLF